MFLWKCVLKMYSKFTEEHPWVFSCKFVRTPFYKNTSGGPLSMKNTVKEDIPILFIFLLKSDCIHTIFIFQHEKQNEKYIFISFTLRVYCLKWMIKRSNFYEGLMTCRFKYNFDWLESDKSKFDWRKYKIHLDKYIRLLDWDSKICHPGRKTNIFVIIGQNFDVEKYPQNHVNTL